VAQSTVKLIVDAQNAIVPLKRVNEQTKVLNGNTDKLKRKLDRSNRSLRDTGKSAKVASTGVKGLVSALRPLLAALAVVGSARFVLFQTAQLETQTKALENLTGSAEEAQAIVQEIKEFGSVTPFKSSELIETTKLLKAFGFETENVVDITKRVADIAGTAGADIDRVAFAIGKVQAKNKFMQEENVMLLEKGVNIQKELQQVTGFTGDQLAKAMSKGEVGANKFVEALVIATSEGGQFFKGAVNQSGTLAGKFSTLQDGIETLAQAVGERLQPALKSALDVAINLVTSINQAIAASSITDVDKKALKKQAGDIVQQQAGSFLGMVGGPFGMGEIKVIFEGQEFKGQPASVQSQITNALINAEVTKRIKEQFAVQRKLEKTTNKPTKDTDKPEPDTLTDEQKANIRDFARGIVGVIKLENNRKEAFKKYIDKQKQSGELIQASIDGNTKEVQLQHDINNAVAEHGEHNRQKITDQLTANQALRDQKTEIDKNAEAAEALKNKFARIGQEIEDGIVSNLTDAVMGTQTLAQSAINVLEQMRRKLVELAIQKAIAGIGGPIGGFFQNMFGFANGGRPPVGRASIVGERGPELFVPSVAGTIVPNNQLGSGGSVNNVVVNVDASGTEVEGNDESSSELGKLVGLAVQQELIKQQRAGGLLSKA